MHSKITKSLAFAFVLLHVITFAQSQNSIIIKPDYDVAIGYHDGYPSSATTNYSNSLTNSLWLIPGHITGVQCNRSLLYFDLNAIPPGATIVSAYLNLYAHGPTSIVSGHTGTNNSAYVQRIIQPWGHYTATWSNQPSTTTTNQVLLPAATNSLQDYLNIPVTSLVMDMLSTNNYGLMLRLVNESLSNALVFSSLEAPDSTKHPTLEVVYQINCPTYVFHKKDICEGDSIFLQGSYQKTSGIYFDTLTNINSYDSIITTSLYVSLPYSKVNSFSICDGDSLFLSGAYRKESGLFPEYYSNIHGCDSIIYNHLQKTVVDTSLTINGLTITANQPGATYQWIDCEVGLSAIPGAVYQSYTPTANGSYAVIITFNGCTAISRCVRVGNIFISEVQENQSIKLIPNPAGKHVTIQLEPQYDQGKIIIRNMHGQIAFKMNFFGTHQPTIDLSSLSQGTYLTEIWIDDKVFSKKLIVE